MIKWTHTHTDIHNHHDHHCCCDRRSSCHVIHSARSCTNNCRPNSFLLSRARAKALRPKIISRCACQSIGRRVPVLSALKGSQIQPKQAMSKRRRTTLKWITYHPRRPSLAGFRVFNKPASSKTKHSNARHRGRRRRLTRAKSWANKLFNSFMISLRAKPLRLNWNQSQHAPTSES